MKALKAVFHCIIFSFIIFLLACSNDNQTNGSKISGINKKEISEKRNNPIEEAEAVSFGQVNKNLKEENN